MQDKVLDAIESALGQSPQPDPDGAKLHERDSDGNLVETRPQHHVDPLGKTEAVAPVVPQKRPKTLLERLEELMQSKTSVEIRTKTGDVLERYRLVEVTEEVVVLHAVPASTDQTTYELVLLVDSIESWMPNP